MRQMVNPVTDGGRGRQPSLKSVGMVSQGNELYQMSCQLNRGGFTYRPRGS